MPTFIKKGPVMCLWDYRSGQDESLLSQRKHRKAKETAGQAQPRQPGGSRDAVPALLPPMYSSVRTSTPLRLPAGWQAAAPSPVWSSPRWVSTTLLKVNGSEDTPQRAAEMIVHQSWKLLPSFLPLSVLSALASRQRLACPVFTSGGEINQKMPK